MDIRKKRKLAAIAGVMNFLKDEQPYSVPAIPTFIPSIPNIWAAYGRQNTMMNNLPHFGSWKKEFLL